MTDNSAPYPVESAEYALFCAWSHTNTAYVTLLATVTELLNSESADDFEDSIRRLQRDRTRADGFNEKSAAALQAFQRRRGTHPAEPPEVPDSLSPAKQQEVAEYEEELDEVEWRLHLVSEDEDSVADRLIEDAGGEPPEEDGSE